MRYLNAGMRDRIYKLGALSAFCAEIAETCAEEERARLRELVELADEVLALWMRNLTPEEREGLLRYIRHNRLVMVPEGVDRKRQYILERGEIEALMADLDFGCAICVNDDRQAKRCRRRKVLMRMGIDGAGTRLGACPYQGGMLARNDGTGKRGKATE